MTPRETNKVVGGIGTDNFAYCRHCIDLLGLEIDDMKVLTNNKAKQYIYNCHNCGKRITKKSAFRI